MLDEFGIHPWHLGGPEQYTPREWASLLKYLGDKRAAMARER